MKKPSPVPRFILDILQAGPGVEAELAMRARRIASRRTTSAITTAITVMGFLLLGAGSVVPAWLVLLMFGAYVGCLSWRQRFSLYKAKRALLDATYADDEPAILVSGGEVALLSQKRQRRMMALLTRAEAYKATRRDREALETIDRVDTRAAAVDLGSRWRVIRASYLTRAGRAEEALAELDEAESGSYAMVPTSGARGVALLMLGRPREAVPLLQQAALAGADDGSTMFHLAEALRILGRIEEARAYYELVT